MDYTDEEIVEAMARLSVSQADLQRAQTSGRALDALQRHVQKVYRSVIFELHPDRTGDDPAKARLFQLVGEVVKEIEGMVAHPHPRNVKWAVKLRLAIQETS